MVSPSPSLAETSPVNVPSLLAAKGREKIAMMTAYDAPSAALLDAAGIDVLLVGDSVEMTVYGRPNTLTATMETMVRHTRAVADAARRALVVGDMPFLSYQADPREAVVNAGRFLADGGAAAVKAEGGRRILPAIQAMLAADIPVMGHVGLTPQSYRKFGGFKVQGKSVEAAAEIREDAEALAEAGCFALVLECVPEDLAAEITRSVAIPTIGIGAGASCDGQVLVFHDVMGLTGRATPRFARRYAELAPLIEGAARAFAKDVRSGEFPNAAETFTGGATPALRRIY
jgi:3-methyl-2-oxobutanoate hydroxymethyltransferase